MTTLYKLTNLQSQTCNRTQWGENVTHELPARDAYRLCSPNVLHAYISPELAVLMDPMQAALLPDAILWEADGEIVVNDGTKVGCIKLTTLKRVPLPIITPEQRVTFAIKCAMHVYSEPAWTAWAQAWLDGSNRAACAAYAADAAAAAADADAAAYAAYAAYAADAAADAAAYAAAHAAADAAHAAHAADAAANAAHAAAHAADADIGFVAQIAKEVCNV